jgi:hypothetical protein
MRLIRFSVDTTSRKENDLADAARKLEISHKLVTANAGQNK